MARSKVEVDADIITLCLSLTLCMSLLNWSDGTLLPFGTGHHRTKAGSHQSKSTVHPAMRNDSCYLHKTLPLTAVQGLRHGFIAFIHRLGTFLGRIPSEASAKESVASTACIGH